MASQLVPRSWMLQAAQLRRKWREKHGAVSINLPESEVRVTDADSIYPDITFRFNSQPDSQAHMLVQELMIMANEAVAKMGEHSVPSRNRGESRLC